MKYTDLNVGLIASVSSSRLPVMQSHERGSSMYLIPGEFVFGLCLLSRHCERFGKGLPHAFCVCVCVCGGGLLVDVLVRWWLAVNDSDHDSFTALSIAAMKCS